MNDSTWVKLYRKSLSNEVRRHDPTAWRLFETLLLLVDSRTGRWSGGRYQLTEADGNLNSSTIYKALQRLEKNGMITIKSNTRFTEISICKFGDYAKSGNTSSNNRVTTNEQPSNTLTRSKKVRSKNISNTDSDKLLEILNTVTGRQFRLLPKGAKATLQDFSLEEIEQALKNMKQDEWHKSKMNVLKSDYLLRATTIDQFVDWKPKKDTRYKDYTNKVITPTTVGLSRKEIQEMEYKT